MALRRNRSLYLICSLALPLCPIAFCQAASGSAAVTLVARLETLSVQLGSLNLQPASIAKSIGTLTLTTAFAVPADYTTFRLASRITAHPEAAAAAFDFSSIQFSPGVDRADDRNVQLEDGQMLLFSQPAGATNSPFSRTDRLELEWDSPVPSVAADAPSKTLEVMVQAL